MAISFSLKKIPIPFCIIIFCVALAACSEMEDEPIKVGILHSQTGTLAPSEVPVADSTLMAKDMYNSWGGNWENLAE